MKIIDLSSRHEFYQINGSINIPYEELINNYRKYLSKKETYYFYCKSGKLSKRIVAVLSTLGYDVYVLEKNR